MSDDDKNNQDNQAEDKDPGLFVAGDVDPEEQVRLDEEAQANDPYQEKADERLEYEHPEGARDYRVQDNDVRDYIGVDPEYQTYANEYDRPILTDAERFDYTHQYDHLEGNAEESDEEKERLQKERDASVSWTGHSVDSLDPVPSKVDDSSDEMGHTEQVDEQRAVDSAQDEEAVKDPKAPGTVASAFPPFGTK